jgi:hypothetical protein
VVEWDQAELVAYLSELGGQAELAVRGAPDPGAAHGALHMAGGAIRDIRHPDEPGDPLPNYCEARMDQGLPVLALRIKDHGWRYAEQIVALIVDELEAAGVAGRLGPAKPCWRSLPADDYDPEADIMGGEDLEGELDERGLPPGFPDGFPVPAGCTLVIAQRAPEGEGTWEHAAWRCAAAGPLEEHLERLRDFGCSLEPASRWSSAEFGGLHGYYLEHRLGRGSVWLYHQLSHDGGRREREAPSLWYLSVAWQVAATGIPGTLPEPVL